MTRDRDQQPKRPPSADDAFLEVTGARARDVGPRARGAAADAAVQDDAEEPHESTVSPEEVRDHLRRRAIFLRELAEARELRRRVTPHRSRRAQIHAALRRRTFRMN
ncbi:hypothetical protein GCM10010191_69090 [Actinomadura vinacea]|uniref:Uncharacterized protein n=1 Tax=Actinomadura vinacea TaxID=115336 RepID=A0ABP5X234_9ACTN